MVSQAKKVVNTDMVELSQSNQNLGRNHSLPTFIVSVGSLRNIDFLADLSLCKVRIFS